MGPSVGAQTSASARRRWVGGAVALVAAHILLAFSIRTPWIFYDELEYWLIAHQLAAGRLAFTWAGAPFNFPSMLYPLMLSPLAHLAPGAMYAASKVVDTLLMGSTAIPVYLMARRLGASERAAGWAAVLAIAVPSSTYSADIMAESLYYPLFTWSLYGTLRVLDTDQAPGVLGCGLWGLLSGSLFLVKPQGLLAPALLAVGLGVRLLGVGAAAVPRSRWLRPGIGAAAGVAVGLGLRLAWLAASGAGVWPLTRARFFGSYANQIPGVPHVDIATLLVVVGLYIVLLGATLGVLPLVHLLSPTCWRLVRTEPRASLAWVLCVTAAAALVMIFACNALIRDVQPAGLDALRLQERYIFPVSGLVFALWTRMLDRRGSEKSGRSALAWAIAIGVATCLSLGLLGRFTHDIPSDAPSLTGLLAARTASHGSEALFALMVVCIGALAAAAQRWDGRRSALVLATLIILSVGAYGADWKGNGTYVDSARGILAQVPQGATLIYERSLPVALYSTIEFWHPGHWRLVSPGSPLHGLAPGRVGSAFVVGSPTGAPSGRGSRSADEVAVTPASEVTTVGSPSPSDSEPHMTARVAAG